MGTSNSFIDLWRYKLRAIGLRNSMRLAYLDLSESLYCQLAKRVPFLSFAPRSIQIECTTRCNLKCTMCEITYWNESGGDLQLANLQKMLEHLPKVKRVDLTGIGEALMNRSFFNALRTLKLRGLYVTLNDNFTLMTEDAARQIVGLGVDQIFLSLDGATRETYEKIRVGAKFEKVIANAKRLIEIKGLMGKKCPEVKINTVVTAENYREIPEIIEVAHDIGVGMVQFVNVITFEKTADLYGQDLCREVNERLQAARECARRLRILIKIELFDKLPVEQCDFPWKRNFVTYDGAVHPCCFTTQTGDRAAQNKRSFGNLISDRFEDVWHSAAYLAFRKRMRQGILPNACEHCPKYCGKPMVEHRYVSTREAVELKPSRGAP